MERSKSNLIAKGTESEKVNKIVLVLSMKTLKDIL